MSFVLSHPCQGGGGVVTDCLTLDVQKGVQKRVCFLRTIGKQVAAFV